MRWAPGRISRGLILLLTVGALLPTRAPAQTKLELHGGDRLRLTREVGGPQHVFWLRDLRGDTLIVSRKRDSAAFAFAPGDLNRFETLVTRSTARGMLHGFGAGILLGAAVGAVTGIIAGALEKECPPNTGTGDYWCIRIGPNLGGILLGVAGGAAGGVLGTVAGAIVPGKRWAEVEPPTRIEFTPGLPPPAPRTTWNIGAGSFIVMDEKWSTGFQAALSMHRSSRRHLESGIVLYCDLWPPAEKAPEGSAVTWESSGHAWLIGIAPTLRISPWESRKGDPRVFLEAAAGVHTIVSDAEMLEYGPVYGRAPRHIDLMDAPLGMLADAGIGWSCPVGGFEPEIAVKLHGVVGKAETASTFMLELGVGF